MAKTGEVTVDIKLNIADETIAACIALINMYLKDSAKEAFVERDENGNCVISIEEKEGI